MTIPEYTDTFGESASIEVILGDTASFLEWDTITKEIRMKNDAVEVPEGSYSYEVVMKDKLGNVKN